MKWSAAPVADVPPPVETVTSTVPLDPAGAVAVIEVLEATVTPEEAEPPKLMTDEVVKPVPAIVTAVPPDVGPVDGLMPVTVGAAR